MHAHRCTKCGTVWVHGDCRAGDAVAHACPKCGEKEWRKWLVSPGALPAAHQPAAVAGHYEGEDFLSVMARLLTWVLCLVMIAYFGFLVYEKAMEFKNGKK